MTTEMAMTAITNDPETNGRGAANGLRITNDVKTMESAENLVRQKRSANEIALYPMKIKLRAS